MAANNTAVFGVFVNRSAAESAVTQLTASGFSNQDISVLMSSATGTSRFATQTNLSTQGTTSTDTINGPFGLLAGVGALTIPGAVPLLAAGPIAAILAGVSTNRAAPGLIAAFSRLGVPDDEARSYDGRLQNGGILLAINCHSSQQVSSAGNLLRDAGGEDIASTSGRNITTQTTNADNELVSATQSNAATTRQVPVDDLDRQPIAAGEASTTRTTYY